MHFGYFSASLPVILAIGFDLVRVKYGNLGEVGLCLLVLGGGEDGKLGSELHVW